MEKAIVICDNFKLIHIGHEWLLKAVDEMMKKDNIQRCYIFVGQEEGDILGQYEKENMLQKLINKNEKFIVYHVESLKIFKEIKQINIDGFHVVKVLVEPEEHSFIKNSLAGLPTIVVPFKHNIDENKIEEYIESGNYQEYCDVMPQTLWAEFQNLKELYAKKKISENIKHKEVPMTKTKINMKELENFIGKTLEKHMKSIDENKKTFKTTKKELYSMIENIILEKLTGHAFNEMHDLKNSVLKQIEKATKHKWVMSVSSIGKKSDGCYFIKLIGSGNTKLSVLWGDDVDGDFSFSTSTSLVAGDEFSTALYSFMNAMVEKKNEIINIFKDVESKIINDNISDDIMDENGEESELDMGMGAGIGSPMMEPEPLEPTVDDIDTNIPPVGETSDMPPAQPPMNDMPTAPTNEHPMMNDDDEFDDEEVEVSLDMPTDEPIEDDEDEEKIPMA